MTANSRFKKEVRARMAVDGVSYTEARHWILAERAAGHVDAPEPEPRPAPDGYDMLADPFRIRTQDDE